MFDEEGTQNVSNTEWFRVESDLRFFEGMYADRKQNKATMSDAKRSQLVVQPKEGSKKRNQPADRGRQFLPQAGSIFNARQHTSAAFERR